MGDDRAGLLDRWLADLEARLLADLRFAEVRRALQALSGTYVRGRNRLARGAALDGAGKRAAFALFYGPLHLLTVARIVRELGLVRPAPRRIVDLGCGTGVAGAAWALEAGRRPPVVGIERHPWAAGEAARTLRALGVRGKVARGDLVNLPPTGPGDAIVLAWAANELDDASRESLLERLLDAAAGGARLLVVEPIARRPVPWWDGWAARFVAAGGRADVWEFRERLPEIVARLDAAAGLDHGTLKARSLARMGAGPRGGTRPPKNNEPADNPPARADSGRGGR